MKEIVYYEDIDSPDTSVRKIPESFELEYISKGDPVWVKTRPNSPYERELYFGEGNNCLYNIPYEEAKKRLHQWGVEI